MGQRSSKQPNYGSNHQSRELPKRKSIKSQSSSSESLKKTNWKFWATNEKVKIVDKAPENVTKSNSRQSGRRNKDIIKTTRVSTAHIAKDKMAYENGTTSYLQGNVKRKSAFFEGGEKSKDVAKHEIVSLSSNRTRQEEQREKLIANNKNATKMGKVTEDRRQSATRRPRESNKNKHETITKNTESHRPIMSSNTQNQSAPMKLLKEDLRNSHSNRNTVLLTLQKTDGLPSRNIVTTNKSCSTSVTNKGFTKVSSNNDWSVRRKTFDIRKDVLIIPKTSNTKVVTEKNRSRVEPNHEEKFRAKSEVPRRLQPDRVNGAVSAKEIMKELGINNVIFSKPTSTNSTNSGASRTAVLKRPLGVSSNNDWSEKRKTFNTRKDIVIIPRNSNTKVVSGKNRSIFEPTHEEKFRAKSEVPRRLQPDRVNGAVSAKEIMKELGINNATVSIYSTNSGASRTAVQKRPLEITSDFEFKKLLETCKGIQKPHNIKISDFIETSQKFKIKFPVQSVRCCQLQIKYGRTVLESCINSAYPVIHESVLRLYADFLTQKKYHGSEEEKTIYDKMTISGLVKRLLEKRAVYFFGREDNYLLMDGSVGRGGWENIGTDAIRSNLNLDKCLSYDEMKLSAFLSVSSNSVFINDGNRNNKGIPTDNEEEIETEGIVIGLIGARFEKPEFMEWQDVIVTKEQNVNLKGYGRPMNNLERHNAKFSLRHNWSKFYDLASHDFPLYEEVAYDTTQTYVMLNSGIVFNKDVFIKRLQFSFETLLLEAQSRAEKARKNAYLHVVGIGLGVWMVSKQQEVMFLEAFASSVKKLFSQLRNVSDINFSWFKENVCGTVKNGGYFIDRKVSHKIRVLFSKRNPHDKLQSEDSGKLLVVSYAWDSNALPGNEFWGGALSASGDPAQAASSQIAELHNPHINSKMVSENNLHIASLRWGVIHIAEYANKVCLGMSQK